MQGTSTSWQKFNVTYEFPVCFTRALFSPENPVFLETLCRLEPAKRHRLLIFVDSGVLDNNPKLPNAIEAICKHKRRILSWCLIR